MKKLTLLLLAFALVFASVGCGSDSGNAAGTEDAAQRTLPLKGRKRKPKRKIPRRQSRRRVRQRRLTVQTRSPRAS